jgi:two-component system LytT family sensor kinase
MQKRWVRHLLFWLPYLVLEVYTEFYWMEVQYKQPLLSTFIHAFYEESLQIFVIKIPMVYLMFYLISKFAQKSQQYVKLIISLTLVLILFTWLGQVLLVHFIVPVIYSHLDIVGFGLGGFGGLMNSFMDKIFIACVAIALREFYASQKLKEREQILIREKVQTELNFLKSQINPHFLFNTLNNIYSLARKKSDDTPDVVLKLSKLLRYILYDTSDDFIQISKEIEFLKDFIDLQKIRFDERLNIRFQEDIDDYQATIRPLILIPLIENAFKHGASQSVKNSFIHIKMKLQNEILEMKVENSFESKNNESNDGIGLNNLKRQLELCYSEFELDIEEKENIYVAHLKINLIETL